jgi:hypothetical protein
MSKYEFRNIGFATSILRRPLRSFRGHAAD